MRGSLSLCFSPSIPARMGHSEGGGRGQGWSEEEPPRASLTPLRSITLALPAPAKPQDAGMLRDKQGLGSGGEAGGRGEAGAEPGGVRAGRAACYLVCLMLCSCWRMMWAMGLAMPPIKVQYSSKLMRPSLFSSRSQMSLSAARLFPVSCGRERRCWC